MEELVKFISSPVFSNPVYFWIGLVLILLLIYIPWSRYRRAIALDTDYWKPHITLTSKRVWILSVPVVIISILLASMLANPQITVRTDSLITGKPVLLLVDVSGSTLGANALNPGHTLQEAAIQTFNSLIELRADINFGLMLYATDNYIARYFTYKNELFKDTLENKDELYRIAQATRTADALAAASQFLANNIEGEEKAMILISDLHYDIQDVVEINKEIEKIILQKIIIYMVSTTGEQEFMAQIKEAPGLKVIDINNRNEISQMYEDLSSMQSSTIRSDELLSKINMVPFISPLILVAIIACFIMGEAWFRKIP